MNICYVANNRFPSERAHMTQMVHMCNAFVLNGHSVTFLVTDRKTSISEDAETFFGVPILFTVDYVPVPDISGRSSHIPHALHPFFFFIQRFVYAYRASRYIRKRTFDLVYGRDEWILWLLHKWVTVPIVWESHEARFSYAARKLVTQIPLVVISEGIRDFYIEHGVSVSRICVAHDAVDERFFSIQEGEVSKARYGISQEKPIVLYVGGLETWKGVEVLCEAMHDEESVETIVVGGKESECIRLQKKYPRIHFLGPRPYRELPMLQQCADVLVVPNTGTSKLSALYTSPLKLFTYMTSQKPIVASSLQSIRNVLSDTEAYFFTPDDPVSLRATIHHVLAEPERAQEKAKAAYQKSLNCTWKMRAKNILTFLSY